MRAGVLLSFACWRQVGLSQAEMDTCMGDSTAAEDHALLEVGAQPDALQQMIMSSPSLACMAPHHKAMSPHLGRPRSPCRPHTGMRAQITRILRPRRTTSIPIIAVSLIPIPLVLEGKI